MHHITRFAVGMLATLALLSAATLSAYAVTPAPFLGAAAKFVALGTTADVTCTKSTVGLGAVGSNMKVTKTPSCSIAGAVHQGDATAAAGNSAFLTAYTALNAKVCPPANVLTGQPLG